MNFLIINTDGRPVYLQSGLPEQFKKETIHGKASNAQGDYGLVVLQEKNAQQSRGRFHFFRLIKDIIIRQLRPSGFLQTIVALEGDIVYSIQGYGKLLLRKGQYLLFPPSVPAPEAELKQKKEYRVFEALYSPDDMRELASFFPYLRKILFNERGEWLPEARAAGYQALDVIREMMHNPYKEEELREYNYNDSLRRLLFLLVAQATAVSNAMLTDKELAYKVKEYILEDLSRDINIDDLARSLYTSTKRLRRAFKVIFHQNPTAFAREERMQLAWKWLTTTHKPVKEISIGLGFQSQQNFATTFKSRFGMTPLEARNNPTAFNKL